MRFVVMLILFVSISFFGCAGMPPPTEQLNKIRANVPTCNSKEDCQEKMENAQVWISRNCTYRIQISNSSLISTFGPFKDATNLAFTVTKEKRDSVWILNMSAGCDNPFGCIPNQWDAIMNFENYMIGNK